MAVHRADLQSAASSPQRLKPRWSLRGVMVIVTLLALLAGNAVTITRLRTAESELVRLRREVGALPKLGPAQIAAIVVPNDEPLTYRFRVSIPSDIPDSGVMVPPLQRASYRIAYSTVLPKTKTQPDWYAALPVFPGESVVTIRVAEDPRDHRWKISTILRSDRGTRRLSTVLPEDHEQVLRGKHDVINTGIAGQAVLRSAGEAIRLLDQRFLVGGQSLLLYGDQAPREDQVGVYAELQPVAG